jgi:phage recombination protein Bet
MNAISTANPSAVYDGRQLDLIRRTVAADCNQSEFDLFVTVARRTGLDPFRKQIYAVVYGKDDAAKRKMTLITGIDGMRAIAARSGRYRPDEDEPEYTYDEGLKGPENPLGLVKARVKIWIADAMRQGGWKPVTGLAHWDEFAPIKEESSEGYRWVDTGEVWPDSGKPKKRKVANEGGEIVRMVDPKTQWPKMPRIMLAKCAEAQALRKAFPEDLSGLYEHAEMDQAAAVDLSPSEIVDTYATESRLARINGTGITFQLFPNAPLEPIELGKVADRVIEAVGTFSSFQQYRWFESANTHPLREFWARQPSDALELKKFMEGVRDKLMAAEAEAGPA